MPLEEFLTTLQTNPESITFQKTMEVITEAYVYSPTAFTNGGTTNEAGTNEGSCKVFAFAELNKLPAEQTLQCFGDYYRKDVLENPDGSDHANIRSFMKNGWHGIKFDGVALVYK